MKDGPQVVRLVPGAVLGADELRALAAEVCGIACEWGNGDDVELMDEARSHAAWLRLIADRLPGDTGEVADMDESVQRLVSEILNEYGLGVLHEWGEFDDD